MGRRSVTAEHGPGNVWVNVPHLSNFVAFVPVKTFRSLTEGVVVDVDLASFLGLMSCGEGGTIYPPKPV